MKTYEIQGVLKFSKDNKITKYRIFRCYDYFDLDGFLWANTTETYYHKVGIYIKNECSSLIFSSFGRLLVDYKKGYERFIIKDDDGSTKDISNILYKNLGKNLIFTFHNFEFEGDDDD